MPRTTDVGVRRDAAQLPLCALGIVIAANLTSCFRPESSPEDVHALFGMEPRIFQKQPGPRDEIHLGRDLFHAPLSRAGKSCASCHDTSTNTKITTADGTVRTRSAAPLRDTGRLQTHGWAGLNLDLEAMIERAFDDPHHVGLPDEESLGQRIRTIAGLAARFPGQRITRSHAAKAIASYLRTLRSIGRWDRFVDGDKNALTAAERHGLFVFVTTGCATCHGNRLLGGRTAHKLGLTEPYETEDPGRFAATGKERDRYVFRAPPLRHAVRTAPYFHDGSVQTLEEAIRIMARVELGKQLSTADTRAIVTFLHAASATDQTNVSSAIPLSTPAPGK